MNNKKAMITSSLFSGILISSIPIDSMANLVEDNQIAEMKKDTTENKLTRNIQNSFNIKRDFERKISKPKENIKVNKNITRGSVHELILNEGDFVPNLSGNPNGYETIKVITNGSKKLVKEDYDNLRLSGIPKVDLSNAYSDSIPVNAFSNSIHLIEFKFPQGITSIERGAFSGCSELTGDLTISNSVKTIGMQAFYKCSKLTGDLIIPDSVTSIGSHAFYLCSKLDGVLKIGNSVESIGNDTFFECSNLTGSLIIPNSITSIGNYAFYNCSGLSGDLIIPDSVLSIGISAFSQCYGFDGKLKISNSITCIENNSFYGCKGFIGELVIPSNVTNIGDNAFRDCSNFTGSLIVPNAVVSIGYCSFYGCTGFNGNLIIGNSVTTIGVRAFSDCDKFVGNLTIPNSVTFIDNYAFKNCSGFNGYLTLGDNVNSIGIDAFYNCSGLIGNLLIPESVTSIGNYAFYLCKGISGDVIIPDSVTSIGNYAFSGCSNIERIFIKIDYLDLDTNYKKSIIDNLPDTTQTVIDVSYNADISGTWIETTNKMIGKPIIKNIIDEAESDLINYKGEAVSLYISSLYQESNISVLKDNKTYNLPMKNDKEKYIFTEPGVYQVTVTTDLGNTSVITFEVEDPIIKEIEETLEDLKEIETIKDVEKISNTRDLINSLPESTRKNQLQEQLNNIFPDLEFEKKIASANLDVYIKSDNILLMSVDTNSITFEDFSGINDMLKDDAVEISINSSLPYNLNAYLMTEIQNSDKTNTMDKEIFQLKEDSEANYQYFRNTNEKMTLKSNCDAGNDKIHLIDFKLKGGITHEKDIYKTVIKFEAEQK